MALEDADLVIPLVPRPFIPRVQEDADAASQRLSARPFCGEHLTLVTTRRHGHGWRLLEGHGVAVGLQIHNGDGDGMVIRGGVAEGDVVTVGAVVLINDFTDIIDAEPEIGMVGRRGNRGQGR